MPTRSRHALAPLVRAVQPADPSDGELLGRFLADRDETAFTALVERHGPMVLGVCRRVLGSEVDDAFQATFLVLVQKARTLARRRALGGWLHEVARRVALKARAAAARRRVKEAAAVRPEAPPDRPRNDWLPLLDEELRRLPQKYREPLVLCDLEGRTRAETARHLGWPEGTVAARLARGRALLGKRLFRRARIPAAGLTSVLTGGPSAGAVPASLASGAVRAALGSPVGLNPTAAALARAAIRTMAFSRRAVVAAGVTLTLLGIGFGAFGLEPRVAPPADRAEVTPPATSPREKPEQQPPAAGEQDGNDSMIVSLRLQGDSVFAATADGLYRANRTGKTWSRLRGKTVPEPGGRFVDGSPDDPALFYFVTRGVQGRIAVSIPSEKLTPPRTTGLYRSRDRGDSWELVTDTHDFAQIVRLPSGRLFALAGQAKWAVLLSDDGGKTWRDVTNGAADYPTLLLKRDPDHPGRVSLFSHFTMRRGGTVLQADDDEYRWKTRLSSLRADTEWPPDAQKTDEEFFETPYFPGYRLDWPAGAVKRLPDEFPSRTFDEQNTGTSTVGSVPARLGNYFSLPFGDQTRLPHFEVVSAKPAYEFRRGQAMTVAVSLVNYDEGDGGGYHTRVLDTADAKLFWGLQVSGPGGLKRRPGSDWIDPFGHSGNEGRTLKDERRTRPVREHLLAPGKPLDRTLDLRDLGMPAAPGVYKVQVLYRCGRWRDEQKVVRRLDPVPGRVFTVKLE